MATLANPFSAAETLSGTDPSRTVLCSRSTTGVPDVHARADSMEVRRCPRLGERHHLSFFFTIEQIVMILLETNRVQPWRSARYNAFVNCHAYMEDAPT